MPAAVLPIAEYLPDMPDFPSAGARAGGAGAAPAIGGSRVIRNVYPRTANSYGPIGRPMGVSSALPSRCYGAAGFINNSSLAPDRRVLLYAGTATKLYRLLRADAYIWQDVSRGASTYNTTDEAWEFEYFNGWVLATNIGDAIQANLITTDVFINLLGDPPKAKHICVVKNTFVVLGFTDDPVGGRQEQRIWWGGAGNLTSWPTPGSVAAAQAQSGFVDLTGSDGEIMAIRTGITGADGLVFQRFGIRRMVYVGPAPIWAFLPAQNARGTPASQSPVVHGGNCYFLGHDGWYVTDGATCVPIGADKVDKTFYADLDMNYVDRIRGSIDPQTKMIWWAYPGLGAQDGVPNHLIGYNWVSQRWSIVDVNVEVVARMIGIGYTLDELYTVLGYTLDTLPASLDSSFWVGGAPQMALFNLNHKLAYLIGPALAPIVETSEMAPVPGRRVLVRGARPLVDGSSASPAAVSVGHRERLEVDVTYTQPVSTNALGNCPVRTSGRYVRARTTIAEGGDWTNISGVELDVQPQGQR